MVEEKRFPEKKNELFLDTMLEVQMRHQQVLQSRSLGSVGDSIDDLKRDATLQTSKDETGMHFEYSSKKDEEKRKE